MELAFLVERVLEVDRGRFGACWALDRTLRLWSGGLTEEEAAVLHTLGTAELEDSFAITNGEGLVADAAGDLDTLERLCCRC